MRRQADPPGRRPSARPVALAALRLWRRQRHLADAIIADVLDASGLSAPDRAFAFDLFYGTLRNLTLLDFWIGELRQGKLDSDLRDILRLGLYQLLIAKIPEHAAVHESVALASQNRRGIVNAILRSALRERARLKAATNNQPLAVRSSHPDFLLERWGAVFGDPETAALCAWNNDPPKLYARVNQLKITTTEFVRRYASNPIPGAALSNFVELPQGLSVRALKAGDCYIQDPSTRIACELLAPQPGETILDACAAPGGKTGYIAELMQDQGTIIATDHQSPRITLLEDNIGRLGIKSARIVKHDWTSGQPPAAILKAAPFDRILVDAPCTNTGVMRRRVDVRWRLQPNEFSRMQKQQIEIVRAVLPLLKTGGVLVYSTCSLEREENQAVVERLLKEMSILRMDAEEDSLPFRDGFDGAYAARLIRVA